MKKWIGVLLLILFLGFTPVLVSANYYDQTVRQQLLAQIEILQRQLANLLELQAAQTISHSRGAAKLNIYKSQFYDGDYEALYFVDGKKITRRDNTTTRVGDQLLWSAYVDMVGDDFITKHNIQEFRIFNDEDNWLSGYVDQRNDLAWILAVNRFGDDLIETYNQDFNVELLLHESAHIVFFADLDYQDDFISKFWQSRAAKKHIKKINKAGNANEQTRLAEDYYENNPEDFVTDYAATNPTEDLIESFVEFVISDYPEGEETKDEKVRFFYQYPELMKWRQELRQSDLMRQAFKVSFI